MSYIVSSLVRQLPALLLQIPLERASFLPTRLKNGLIRARLATVLADLERLQDQDLLALGNIGEESVVSLIRNLRCLFDESGVRPDLGKIDELEIVMESSLYASSEDAKGHNEVDYTSSVLAEHLPSPYLVPSTLRESLRAAIRSNPRSGYQRPDICRRRLEPPQGATLKEVANQVGLTRERVRQIVSKGLIFAGKQPVAQAIQSRLATILDEFGCVRVVDLSSLDPWFGSIPAPGLWVVLNEFHPSLTWMFDGNWLVSRAPHKTIEEAITSTLEDLMALTLDHARANLHAICERNAASAEYPGLPYLLRAIGEERLAGRRTKLSEFVKDYILSQTTPFALEALCQAARLRGLDVSEHVARNAVAAVEDIHAIGKSMFATGAMLFGVTSEKRDMAATLLEKIIDARPNRQFHAEELLDKLEETLGMQVASSIGDVHRLAALLRVRKKVRSLGRLVFVSETASPDVERVELLPSAQRILVEVGHPVSKGELLSRISEVRGIGTFSVQALLASLVEVETDVYWLDALLHPKSSIDDDILLEDAYSVISPGEFISAPELRRRLAERTGEAALEMAPSHIRKVLISDNRFAVSSDGRISLADIPARRNPFDSVAS